MARSSACLDFLLLLLSSDSIAFPFYFFSFLPRLRGFVSPPDVHWRRNVCSRGGDVLSAVVGFIPIRGSNNDKRPVVGRTVATSTSRNLIRNGGLRTRITFAGFMRCKRKSKGRASTTGGATVSNIPGTCGATRFPSENGASGCGSRPLVSQNLDWPELSRPEKLPSALAI